MKKNVTYVPASAIEAIVTELNLPTLTQSAFIKVMGAKGRNLYVPRGKSIGHVDFSGFTVEHLGVVDLGEKSFGNVKQMINFEGAPEVILGTIKDVLETMLTLPPVEKAAKVKAPVIVKPVKAAKAKPAKAAKVEAKPVPEAKLPRTREERQKLRDSKLQEAFNAAQAKVDAEATA